MALCSGCLKHESVQIEHFAKTTRASASRWGLLRCLCALILAIRKECHHPENRIASNQEKSTCSHHSNCFQKRHKVFHFQCFRLVDINLKNMPCKNKYHQPVP